VNSNTITSMSMSSTRGSSAGAIVRSNATAVCASDTPSAPPASASTTLSDSSARAIRSRLRCCHREDMITQLGQGFRLEDTTLVALVDEGVPVSYSRWRAIAG
jgi:hypothetical protein